MGVTPQRLIEYPDVSTLFDSATVKQFSGRRAVYNVAPLWKPRVVGIPYTHQYWSLACLLQHLRFLVLADTGLGKTKIALDAIEYYFQAFTHVKHALVLTGRPISTEEWTGQAIEYIGIPAHNVAGTPSERRAQLTHFPTCPITVTDYCTLQTTFTEKRKVGKSSRLVPMVDQLAAFGRQFDLVVLDEIHRLKNTETVRFQMVHPLVQEISIRFGLTGTLFDRHPEDAWAQFFLIDDGETFGNQNDFLHYFFDPKKNHFSKYSVDWKIKKLKKEEFKRRIRHRSIRIAKKECRDIPEVRFAPIALGAAASQIRHIREAEGRVQAAREREERNTEFQFLRQICSSLQRVKGEDLNLTLRLAENPKMDWLIDFLESLPKEEQLVIFYEFRASGEWINEVLTGSKHKVSWLYGGVKDEITLLDNWKKGRTRILLTQTQKAAESLNLQQAAYLVQYERPLTYLHEKQSTARVGGRIGGRQSIIYQLSIRGSIEQRIIELIHEGMKTSQDLLEVPDYVQGRLFEGER